MSGELQKLQKGAHVTHEILGRPWDKVGTDLFMHKDKVKFLGHVYGKEGVKKDETKVKAVMDIKSPVNEEGIVTKLF